MPKIKLPKTKRENRLAALQRKMPPITDPHGVRRLVALLFGFHGCCENVHCRRAKKCLGETASCFDAFWPVVPEIRKDLFREMIKARHAGAKTAAEIEQRAVEAVMRHYSMTESLAAARNGVASPEVEEAPARNDAPSPSTSQPNCRTPRLTAAPSRIAYKSVMFS
jgi:hypothetical protein